MSYGIASAKPAVFSHDHVCPALSFFYFLTRQTTNNLLTS